MGAQLHSVIQVTRRRRVMLFSFTIVALGFLTPPLEAQKRIANELSCPNCVAQTPKVISSGARLTLTPQSLQCPQLSFSPPLGTNEPAGNVTTLRSLNEQLTAGAARGQAAVIDVNCLASPVRLSPRVEFQGAINLMQAHRLFRRPSRPDTLKCSSRPSAVRIQVAGQMKC